MRKLLGISALTIVGAPLIASAHAFGQQYTLPIPLTFYVGGGVIAFMLSCFFLLFSTTTPVQTERTLFTLSNRAWRALGIFVGTVLLAVLLVGLTAGLFGPQNTYGNILPILFWIGLVLAIPYLSILISGWWELGNPFRQISDFILGHAEGTATWQWGYVPALVGYVLLIYLELFLSPIAALPLILTAVLMLYTCMLIVGSMRYGTERWFRFADFISLFIRLAGMLAPLRLEAKRLVLRSPIYGLVREYTEYVSLSVFVLFALAATAYDGFHETTPMATLLASVPAELNGFITHLIFIGFPVLFFTCFTGALVLMRLIMRDERPLLWHIRRFTFSLVPIVLAYHVAHYVALLIATGYPIVALISDPFGLGWNLFGTAHISTTVLISTDIIWYAQLFIIVAGHALAAYVAHLIALIEFGSRRSALVSQIPLIVLMVFFTGFGLWILAQPFAPGSF